MKHAKTFYFNFMSAPDIFHYGRDQHIEKILDILFFNPVSSAITFIKSLLFIDLCFLLNVYYVITTLHYFPATVVNRLSACK